jgi:menaquinol-cytochrome c reductase iron-sulfur subunit
MSGSNQVNRRDFIKAVAAAVGGLITAVVGLPAIAYLLDPAFRTGGKDAWIQIGALDKITVGEPYPFSFTRVHVNGWERTANNYGGFILRRSEAPTDLLILSSRCTHLSCRVNWNEQAQVYLCPCHDGKFSIDGQVLGGPPPKPLDRYSEFTVDEKGNILIHFVEG